MGRPCSAPAVLAGTALLAMPSSCCASGWTFHGIQPSTPTSSTPITGPIIGTSASFIRSMQGEVWRPGPRVQEGETLALGRHWQFWQFWCSEGIASTSGEEPYTTTDEAAAFPNETADSGAGEEPYTTTDETGLEEGEAFTSSTAAARPGTTPTACTCTAPGTATGTPVSNPHRCHTNRDEAEPHGSKMQGQA